jgi:hypothetical protein
VCVCVRERERDREKWIKEESAHELIHTRMYFIVYY